MLHLGIVSSLQQSVCGRVLPKEPTGVCCARIMVLQLLVGYAATLAVGWRWERARRRSFLKHVRAERPEPPVVRAPRESSRPKRALRQDASLVSH